MQKNGNKPMDVIVVNNDFEKMENKKRTIMMNNAAAIKTNKSIDRARRINMFATLLTSVIASVLAGFYFWNHFNFKFHNVSLTGSKGIILALIVVVIFSVMEGMSIPFNTRLKKKKQDVLTLGESINFTTFLRNKKITHYSVTNYKDLPYATQKAFLTIQAVDETGYVTEYVSVDSWNLYVLPFIFETMIDAENTSIYIPCENDSSADEVRDKIKDQIVQEQLSIEREAREKAEKQIANLLVEKQAMDRLLRKHEDTITGLESELTNTQEQLNTADTRFNAEKTELLIAIEDGETKNRQTESLLKNTQEELERASKDLAECMSRETELKTALTNIEESCKTQIENAIQQHQERISTLEASHKTMREEYEQKIDTITQQHAQEKAALTERFTAAAQKAKDALEQRYSQEINDLKDELQLIAAGNNAEELAAELARTQEELRKETLVRTAREKELSFEREKIKSLEEKIYDGDKKMTDAVQTIAAEKENLEIQLHKQIEAYNKLQEEKAMGEASFGVQERALIKEKETLLARNKHLEDVVSSMKDYEDVKAENSKLKVEIEQAKSEDIETVKKDCAERIAIAKEEVVKMEKKMREALESAAHEKAERIKSQNTLRQYLSEQEQTAFEKKMAEQEAEMEKARKMAEKAKQDAINSQKSDGKTDTSKRAPRHLNY